MKNFEIPHYYKSNIVSKIKEIRKNQDKLKKDFSPTILEFNRIQIILARHFGFCFGVENAIEKVYRLLENNPEKRIYLLSEMIHNPGVNEDLVQQGVSFIFDSGGTQTIDWHSISASDIVVIPAFGTTVEIENILKEIGIEIHEYNTTCPFVERVWNRAEQLTKNGYTVIIHGKNNHEETKATFSHTIQNGKSLIIRNIQEAKLLAGCILDEFSEQEFYALFGKKCSSEFDIKRDLEKIGVVNQTTMLASETEEISSLLKEAIKEKYGEINIKDHFADTRDTLCYATNDNQNAVLALLNYYADYALVVGGYNSSNTSHLVELLNESINTYFVNSSANISLDGHIRYYDIKNNCENKIKLDLEIPKKQRVMITSGASCPDSQIEKVIIKILKMYGESCTNIEEAIRY